MASACQTNGSAPAYSPAVGASSGLFELIEYGNQVRSGFHPDLATEHRRLSMDDSPHSADAIRLALLLSVPDTPYYDIGQAMRLLRNVVDGEPPATDDTALAALLLHLLGESVYSAPEEESLVSRLTEARERNQQLSAALASARTALAEERKRRLTLEEQLDALKRLEDQLSVDSF